MAYLCPFPSKPGPTKSIACLLRPPTPSSPLRILIACGGSGGHIFPALAIADAIRTLSSSTSISFLGSPSSMESSLVPSLSSYPFHPVPRTRLRRPFLNPINLLLPFRLLLSMLRSLSLIRILSPDLVVGTGAYVSMPVLLSAVLFGLPIVIQEQNSHPGITNRILAPYAAKIFVAFNSCLKYFPREKCEVVGNPCRVRRLGIEKEEARGILFGKKLGEEGLRVVLVLGGSTGANAVNVEYGKLCSEMLIEDEGRFVIWQTGKEWYDEVRGLMGDHPRLILKPFLDEIELAYAAADVVVSRAGAMTCTEILNTGKPSILIPSPTAADDHQTENAYMMADIAGSKVLIEEELDSSSLKTAINEVLGDENLMADMSEKAMRAARPNASSDIARSILSLFEPSFP